MPRFTSADHPLIKAVAWEPEKPAERVTDTILFARGTSNAHVVTTPDGDIVINTGMPYQGARDRERFEQLLGRKLAVRKIILTQSHPDHMGGWGDFADEGAETIITHIYPFVHQERSLLNAYFGPRGQRIVGNLMPNPEHLKSWKPEANVDQFLAATRYVGRHQFTLGGVEVHCIATPSGETIDSQIVWLPAERVAFTGNLTGALWGALPHFYTPRGDRDRSIPQFLRDIQMLIDLRPAILVTGHEEPIRGEDAVAAGLTRLRDAVCHIHYATVEGMNAGRTLEELMAEIALPPALQTAPGRGPVRWYVRAVWEEYTGWFRHDSTTELYAVPQKAVWPDLIELAGGTDALAVRAGEKLAQGKPVEALHLTDIVLASDPAHAAARTTEIGALEALVEATGGLWHDELTWLEWKLREARAAREV